MERKERRPSDKSLEKAAERLNASQSSLGASSSASGKKKGPRVEFALTRRERTASQVAYICRLYLSIYLSIHTELSITAIYVCVPLIHWDHTMVCTVWPRGLECSLSCDDVMCGSRRPRAAANGGPHRRSEAQARFLLFKYTNASLVS